MHALPLAYIEKDVLILYNEPLIFAYRNYHLQRGTFMKTVTPMPEVLYAKVEELVKGIIEPSSPSGLVSYTTPYELMRPLQTAIDLEQAAAEARDEEYDGPNVYALLEQFGIRLREQNRESLQDSGQELKLPTLIYKHFIVDNK